MYILCSAVGCARVRKFPHHRVPHTHIDMPHLKLHLFFTQLTKKRLFFGRIERIAIVFLYLHSVVLILRSGVTCIADKVCGSRRSVPATVLSNQRTWFMSPDMWVLHDSGRYTSTVPVSRNFLESCVSIFRQHAQNKPLDLLRYEWLHTQLLAGFFLPFNSLVHHPLIYSFFAIVYCLVVSGSSLFVIHAIPSKKLCALVPISEGCRLISSHYRLKGLEIVAWFKHMSLWEFKDLLETFVCSRFSGCTN